MAFIYFLVCFYSFLLEYGRIGLLIRTLKDDRYDCQGHDGNAHVCERG